MDISTITHVTSDYIKNALEESAKASKTENRDFGSVFHNCIPGFRPLMWDFLEHYSVETAADGTVTRYYSASGFEQDDAVVIQ